MSKVGCVLTPDSVLILTVDCDVLVLRQLLDILEGWFAIESFAKTMIGRLASSLSSQSYTLQCAKLFAAVTMELNSRQTST